MPQMWLVAVVVESIVVVATWGRREESPSVGPAVVHVSVLVMHVLRYIVTRVVVINKILWQPGYMNVCYVFPGAEFHVSCPWYMVPL